MLLSKPEITKMFRKAAQVWNENKDYLSEIDSRFGDGDHGVTIGKIAGLIEKSLDGWDDDDVETFLEDLGDNTMEIGGGSADPERLREKIRSQIRWFTDMMDELRLTERIYR